MPRKRKKEAKKFDGESLDAYLQVADRCRRVRHLHEQACHARRCVKEAEDDGEQAVAKEAIEAYVNEVTLLAQEVAEADNCNVPVGSIQALLMKELPQGALRDALELQTA